MKKDRRIYSLNVRESDDRTLLIGYDENDLPNYIDFMQGVTKYEQDVLVDRFKRTNELGKFNFSKFTELYGKDVRHDICGQASDFFWDMMFWERFQEELGRVIGNPDS